MAKTIESILEYLTEKVEAQHDKTDSRLDSIEKVLISQELNLQLHMKRSDNLEEIVLDMKEKELKPIQRHVSQVEGAVKLLGLMALLITIATGLGKLFGLI